MNTSHADRNLLFGIMALQMDFISRDALVGAMNAWVLEKPKSLGQVLLEQQRIKEDERTLLEALVDKHLARHNHDPQSSLAAVPKSEDVCEELAKIADIDVQSSLRHLAGEQDIYRTQVPSQTDIDPANAAGSGTLGSGPSESGAPSGHSQGNQSVYPGNSTFNAIRFQVLRPHAKGGLGQVSVAEDTELHREVALKEIQPAYAGDMHSRSRFLLEAEITGGLEHPGIVPVYGLGHYDDGRPYYAMRFIRGDSLRDAIEQFYKRARGRSASDTALELRNLIGRLVDVCNAMEYAHSRGVLHRDLKPGNIMLGKYGETLVVDWGLAKTLDHEDPAVQTSEEGSLRPQSVSASAPTVFGTAVGTPQFMSPEQAAGQVHMLGPFSDVYSLGATLYCILTGKPPYDERDISTVLQRVQRGDFERPRKRNASLPKPLEAICIKAMARLPIDRYSSPAKMADDLERWLADEPVTAYQETVVERAGRWLRRNRTWALTAAAALIAITGISLLAAGMINQARLREAAARRDAETNFLLARKAVDDFFTQVSETTLLDVPGLQPLRKNLLKIALDYDQEFLRLRGQEPNLQQEAAAAEFRIGTVIGEIGSKREAQGHFQQARKIQQDLVRGRPANIELRMALASTINALGGLQQATGKLSEAQTHFDEACQMRETLAKEQPDHDEIQRKLANSYNNLGVIERTAGQPGKALPWYVRANDVRAKLVAKDGQNQLFRRDLARGYYNVAVVQREANELDASADSFKQSIELYAQLVADFPLVIEYRRELGMAHKTLGDLRSHTDRFQDAQECYERARGIQLPLAHDNPVLVELAADLAGTFKGLGDLESLQGNADEALRLHEEAGAILKQLVTNNPAVPRFQSDLAGQQLHLGALYLESAEPAKANEYLQNALAIYERMHPAAGEPALERAVAKARMNLGYLAFLEQKYDEALQHYQAAHDVYVRLAGGMPEDARLQDDLGFSLCRIAGTKLIQGDDAAALASYESARKLHERWVDGPAATLEHRQHLAETLYGISGIQLEQEKWAEAVAGLQRAAELYAGLQIHHPKKVRFREMSAACFYDQATALWKLQRPEEELQAVRRATEEQRLAFELNPKDGTNRQKLSDFLGELAAAERDGGRIDEALALCSQRRKLWPDNPVQLYFVAREIAILATQVAAGAKDPPEAIMAKRDELVDLAINILADAAKAGFTDWKHAEQDEHLSILRDAPAYKALAK